MLMSDDDINYKEVENFLKNKYPGDQIYQTFFMHVAAIQDVFNFVFRQNHSLFAHMDQSCQAFQYLAKEVIAIQQEAAAQILSHNTEKQAM